MTTPQMTPYTPSLYQPDSYGRYRIYPHVTETPIPGAGFRVGQLFWGEQQLNLDGSTRPQPYGTYSTVPLRGLGQFQVNPKLLASGVRTTGIVPPGAGDQGGMNPAEMSPEDYGFDAASEIAAAAAASQAAQDAATTASLNQEESFLKRKLGPVPYWAIGLGALAVLGGGGYVFYRRRRRA